MSLSAGSTAIAGAFAESGAGLEGASELGFRPVTGVSISPGSVGAWVGALEGLPLRFTTGIRLYMAPLESSSNGSK